MDPLGAVLKKAREASKLSIREASGASGVSSPYISQLERGIRKDPHLNILKKLAQAYGLELRSLLQASGHLPPKDNEGEQIALSGSSSGRFLSGQVSLNGVSRARQFRALLEGPSVVLLAGAHDGISAKIAEEAGFDAIWASGFSVSAARGMPDANLLTMSENLEAARQMNDAVALPIIADCDNGYGNAINVIRTVVEYERAGLAGICIEDNAFPKRCSLYPGVRQELVSVEEHVGKLQAAKANQQTPEFFVMARCEALIAGWGMGEALRRARAYADAGADAILIHSRSPSPEEVREFARQWDRPCPLVSVPTMYKTTSVKELSAWGFKAVIFANQALRACVFGMREVFQRLLTEGQASAVDDRIVPLEDVYQLIDLSSMKRQEQAFLPVGGHRLRALIVAAGPHEELLPLTEDRPKAMLDIKGKSILERQVETLNTLNIREIAVVRGYLREKVNLPNLRYYDNLRFRETHILSSLFCAEAEMEGPFLFLYGDVLFERQLLEGLLRSTADVSLLVDRSFSETKKDAQFPPELVMTDPSLSLAGDGSYARVLRIGRRLDPEQSQGEFVGLCMFSERGTKILREVYQDLLQRKTGAPLHEAPSLEQAGFTDMIQELIQRGEKVVAFEALHGWMDVDTFEDYQRAWSRVR